MNFFSKSFLLSFVSLVLTATQVITFHSEEELNQALAPYSLEEVNQRVAQSTIADSFQFEVDPHIQSDTSIDQKQNLTILLETPLYIGEYLTLYYPKAPKLPFHLCIAFHRDVKGLSDVTLAENRELFELIEKITQVYQSHQIEGFVLVQYDTPEQTHMGRFVVEVIPHLPGFQEIKNNVDKVDLNRYMLFRSSAIISLNYPYDEKTIKRDAHLLTKAFKKTFIPFQENFLSYPRKRYESHTQESQLLLKEHLIELMQSHCAKVDHIPLFSSIPNDIPEDIKTIDVQKCFFCDHAVIQRQLIFETEFAYVFYNMRQFAPNGDAFLILSKRHVEKVAATTEKEREDIFHLRQALTQVLKELRPDNQIVVYIQDNPATGQTVFHHHEQLASIDPKTIALSWTLLSLFPKPNISDLEMKNAQERFKELLRQKFAESHLQVIND